LAFLSSDEDHGKPEAQNERDLTLIAGFEQSPEPYDPVYEKFFN
jgi:hypothetical protein